MDACEVNGTERGDTDNDGEDAVSCLVAKVLAVHKQESCTGDEAHNDRAQPAEGPLHSRTVVVPSDPMASEKNQQERWQDDGKGGNDRAPYRTSNNIANVGSTVDANGAWRHLRDGDDVGKHLARDPARADNFALDEREHGIASTEAKQSYLEISPDEF